MCVSLSSYHVMTNTSQCLMGAFVVLTVAHIYNYVHFLVGVCMCFCSLFGGGPQWPGGLVHGSGT